MTIYEVVYETTATGASAYVLNLPGVIAAGASVEEVRRLMSEAIGFHLEGLGVQDAYAIIDAVPRFEYTAEVQTMPASTFSPIVMVSDSKFTAA